MIGNKVYITSKACYIVQTETNHIAAYLTQNGYKLVDRIKDADAIIITTCAVTESAATTTYNGIQECINQRNNNVPVYVVGCYPRIEKEGIKELSGFENVISIPEVKDIEEVFLGDHSWETSVYNDFFSHPFGNERLKEGGIKLPLLKKIFRLLFSAVDSLLNTQMLFYFHFRKHLYNPEIQRQIWPIIASKGCIHSCSYCAVRRGRGKHTSKVPFSIINETNTGIEKGYSKFLLIGDELGTYGIDLKDGTTLSSLLKKFGAIESPFSLGFWYLDCFNLLDVAPQIEELCKQGKVFFLGITLQSGSRRILNLMNRQYSVKESMKVIKKFRKYPDIIIATQIMVGFPTETKEDFQKSVEIIDKGYFDLVEVYEYSPRPGTPAAKMKDDIPPSVKAKRVAKLMKVVTKHNRKLFIKKIINEIKNRHNKKKS